MEVRDGVCRELEEIRWKLSEINETLRGINESLEKLLRLLASLTLPRAR